MDHQPRALKIQILMHHGFTQSGPLFHAKARALEKNLEEAFPPASANKPVSLPAYPGNVELFYPTAPVRLSSADIPGFGVQSADETTQKRTDGGYETGIKSFSPMTRWRKDSRACQR